MEHIDKLINIVIANFDFAYMIIVNIFTYFIIKTVDYFDNKEKITTFVKRICLLCSIIIITCIYVICGYSNKIVLVNSAVLAPVFWSWILKPICIKLGIDYKNIDNCLTN